MPRAPETAAERQQRLAEIRRQIKAGTYETRERISAAIDAILEDFADPRDEDSALGLDRPDELDESSGASPRPR